MKAHCGDGGASAYDFTDGYQAKSWFREKQRRTRRRLRRQFSIY
jgi:hypothetical protein